MCAAVDPLPARPATPPHHVYVRRSAVVDPPSTPYVLLLLLLLRRGIYIITMRARYCCRRATLARCCARTPTRYYNTYIYSVYFKVAARERYPRSRTDGAPAAALKSASPHNFFFPLSITALVHARTLVPRACAHDHPRKNDYILFYFRRGPTYSRAPSTLPLSKTLTLYLLHATIRLHTNGVPTHTTISVVVRIMPFNVCTILLST